MRFRYGMLVAVIGLVALLGCTKIDYIGKSYFPTERVDVYFSLDDVSQEYEVMGHMVAHAGDMVSAEKMQKKMIEKAKEKGADAVVILGLERYQSGENSNTTETSEDDDGKTKVKSSTSTSAEYEKEITATLLKYK